MYKSYWNLFWTTGLPHAWLMSRDRGEPAQAPDSLLPGERQMLSGPLADLQPRSDNSPGGPMKLY